jgi:hypothetical protein
MCQHLSTLDPTLSKQANSKQQTGTSVLFIYLHQMNNLIFKQYAP